MGQELDREQLDELRRIGMENDIRWDKVDSIIDAKKIQPPKRSFDISVSSQEKASNKVYLGAAVSGLAGDVLLYFSRRSVEGGNNGLLEIIIGIVCIIVGLLSLVGGSTVHVTGQELRINGRGYFASDIERISCKGVFVKVLSGGKSVLSLRKTDTGCDELIRWAKFYDIAIDNVSEAPSRLTRALLIVGAVLGVAAVTAILILFVIKA